MPARKPKLLNSLMGMEPAQPEVHLCERTAPLGPAQLHRDHSRGPSAFAFLSSVV